MTTDPIAGDLHGRGLAFPLRLGPTGALAESAGVERIEESIRMILGTRPGERVMRPTFGCELGSLAFAPNDPTTAHLARHHVETALRTWEPRIEVVRVDAAPDQVDPAVLLVVVLYRITGETVPRRLDVPFTLEHP
ncbi:GPW/gp25 family protein [Pseudonocardia endophytica]|uniref:IraD/Gp25-like domain-containing protein n=1 Tax=Pseudonocardia endophytica TaxID=401976 RepID=A0A4R1HLK9_PSEEN|nr:GPW/gp25 family protein [Pseudonocardia endophytica]TCK22868.1 hypothetical protein EV378_6879 [Pseudonocardia endophytica]